MAVLGRGGPIEQVLRRVAIGVVLAVCLLPIVQIVATSLKTRRLV